MLQKRTFKDETGNIIQLVPYQLNTLRPNKCVEEDLLKNKSHQNGKVMLQQQTLKDEKGNII